MNRWLECFSTGIGVTGEVASPLDESAALVLARSDRIAADGADDA